MPISKTITFALMALPAVLCGASPVAADHPLADGNPTATAPEITASSAIRGNVYLRPAATTLEALKLTPGGAFGMSAAPFSGTLELLTMGRQSGTLPDAATPFVTDDAVTGWRGLSPFMPFTGEPSSVMEFQAAVFDPQRLGGNSPMPSNGTTMVRQFSP